MLFAAATLLSAGEQPTPRLIVAGPILDDDGSAETAIFGIDVLDAGSEPIVLDFTTVACTAEASTPEVVQDFVATTGSTTIPAGVEQWTVEVELEWPDPGREREGFETFRLELENVAGAAIEDGIGEAVLRDTRPVLSPTPGDLEPDSDADLWVEYAESLSVDAPKRVVVWTIEGTGVNATCLAGELQQPEEWRAAGVADFDEDGRPDVVWWHPSGEVGFTVAASGGEVPPALPLCPGGFGNVMPPIPSVWEDTLLEVVATGRFSGLGVDIVIFDPLTREIRLVPIDANLQRRAGLVLAQAPNDSWRPIGVGDFDASGSTDVLLRSSISGRHVIWFYDGLVKTGERFLDPDTPVDDAWRVVGTGDYNGDLHADLLLQNQDPNSPQLQVWFLRDGSRLCGRFLEPDRLDLPQFPGPWIVLN